MHEQSLVRSLLTQVEELKSKHRAVTVDSVTVEIGPLSGVEAELIEIAWDQLAPLRFPNRPRLVVQMVPLQVRCQSCGGQSRLPNLSIRCCECGSVRVHITSGDEFRLIDVDMQVPAQQPI